MPHFLYLCAPRSVLPGTAARPCGPARRKAGGWQGLATLALAALVHGAPAAAEGAATQAAHAAAPLCQDTPATRAALQGVAQELKAQGLALRAVCTDGAQGGGWKVQVQVVDGFKAIKVVRGPLADGHEVDMGTPAGVALAAAQPSADGFSPDVQHNRSWLRALMARHRFDNLPDAWWHFAQRDAVPAQHAATNIASR